MKCGYKFLNKTEFMYTYALCYFSLLTYSYYGFNVYFDASYTDMYVHV